MEKNSVSVVGTISRFSEVKKNKNGEDFMYFDLCQRENGRNSYFPVYCEGEILKDFLNSGFKSHDRVRVTGKLESFRKDNVTRVQIRPNENIKAELINEVNKSNEMEM